MDRNLDVLPVQEVTSQPARQRLRLAGAMVFLLLCAAVLIGLGDSFHSRLLYWGEALWKDYYVLNPNITKPTCSTTIDVDREVQRQMELAAEDSFLFDEYEVDERDVRQSVLNNLAQCQQAHQRYQQIAAQLTPSLITYKELEKGLANFLLSNLDAKKYLLQLMLLGCAVMVCWKNEHISLLPAESESRRLISNVLQLLANSAIAYSFYSYWQILKSVNPNDPLITIQLFWLTGFTLLILVTLYRIIRQDLTALRQAGTKDLLAAPLYAIMTLIGFAYLILAENHAAGVAIFINQLTNLANIFINVGLYVFVGMTLKHTRLPALCFDLLRPWQLAPAALATIIIFATAWPTAFTGASGIFILAVGGVIYDEMRRAGAHRSLSLSTTAMSGSLGVVLNPCLLIVIIAALNKEVTTDQLYGWGLYIYLLSAAIFSGLVLGKSKAARLVGTTTPHTALRETLAALKPLVPYLVTVAAVLISFKLILGLQINEHNAPVILPIVLTGILFYERLFQTKKHRIRAFAGVVSESASDSSIHIGALLLLIMASICLGGVIEKSHLVEQIFPQSLGSVWVAMLISILLLVVIGMFMDPFGAVILVTATFASYAIQSGIAPIHFWMVALVAFELGYLSPPVALNQLLTRLVVGTREWDLALQDQGPNASLLKRFEHMWVPLVVLLTTLVIVGFVPLLFYA